MKNQNASDTELRQSQLKVGILGARGYSGLETLRCLLKHPAISEVFCFHHSKNIRILDFLPELTDKKVHDYALADLNTQAPNLDVVFMATPVEASMEWAPVLLQQGLHVIDLSGAFRLQGGDSTEQIKKFRQWYKTDHHCPQLIAQAIYGLSPWSTLKTPMVKAETATLISNPGCYATSVQMAILPLLRNGIIDANSIIVDAKSGTSGAGRKASENLIFTEVDGECLPYKVGEHQHTPEIVDQVFRFSEVEIDPQFTTHLLNVRRGIISSIYLRFSKDFKNQTDVEKTETLNQVYHKFYGEYPLVEFGELDKKPNLLSLKRVVGSPRTQIAYKVQGPRLYVFSLIDNLLKGAASQAVENLNLIYGWPVETGLAEMEGVL